MKIKTILSFAFLSICWISCENAPAEKKDTPNVSIEPVAPGEGSVQKVGDDLDAHGCKGSAGFVWSKIKETCIRTWEEGILLTSLKPVNGAIMRSTVILSKDESEAELFIVDEKESVLLEKDNGIYTSGDYQLIQEGGGWKLRKGGEVIYEK